MRNFDLVCCDTDAITIAKFDGAKFNTDELNILTEELNSIFPIGIRWEFEFNIPKMIVLKKKNYIMFDGHKISMKGGSLKSSKIEPICKQMLNEMIEHLVYDRLDQLKPTLEKYKEQVQNVTDITPLCSKKALSPTTYKSKRKNETDIIDAVKNSEYRSGDRVYLFVKRKVVELPELYKVGPKKGQPKTKEVNFLVLKEDFDGDYCKEYYLERLETITKLFSPVLGKDFFK